MTTNGQRPLAVVTGASSGIGFELAKQFATNGFDLIIAAEDAELTTAEQELRSFGATVEAVRVDLTTPTGVEELYTHLRDRRIPAAALHPCAGPRGPFPADDLAHEGEENHPNPA